MEALSYLLTRAVCGGFLSACQVRGRGGEGSRLICDKSELILVGRVENVDDLACDLGCKVGSLPSTYLGMPLGAPFNSVVAWDAASKEAWVSDVWTGLASGEREGGEGVGTLVSLGPSTIESWMSVEYGLQVQFSSVLHKRLPAEAGVSVVCVSPGVVQTNVIFRVLSVSELHLAFMQGIFLELFQAAYHLIPYFIFTPQEGSRSALFAATDPQIPEYCEMLKADEWPVSAFISQDCNPTNPSEEAHNIETSYRVWEKTLELIGLPLDSVERLIEGEEVKCRYGGQAEEYDDRNDTIPYLTALTTLFSYGLLFAFGQFRDFFRKIFDWWKASNLQGYAPICLGLEDFYIRRLYLRIQDCFGRPISSAPDAWFDVVERFSNDNNKTLKRTTKISTCSTRVDGGTTTLHKEVEECVANFVGKPAAIVFGMGYVTNSAILPVLIGKVFRGLIISDSLNHNSIVNGARGSGATVRVFQHNIPSHLEKVLREQIAEGQPRTHRPWKKIIVVVEGIYSMEGELCKLPEIVAICKKYKVGDLLDGIFCFLVCSSTQKNLQSSGACYRYASMTYKAYVYLDEAHSIGAVGKTGRGVCELLGVDTADVDIMMGTFTKSFGSCGGYIAGSKVCLLYVFLVLPLNLLNNECEFGHHGAYLSSSTHISLWLQFELKQSNNLEPHHPHPDLLPPKPGFRGLLRISVSIPDECALNSLFNKVLNLNQVALVWEGDWLRFYRATLPKYNNQGDGLNVPLVAK
ncbi:Long chain base biosynthesis protein 2a [Vitis vinifera]|uniref:serine C-palmitoyltransferase n=1 Tax=Vitis vinifera TaxID=29760 RepID=A0A438EY40_VITVI|nr:Long chain base biosynthesis protein 2a [Vitis vinifera]